MVIWVCWGQGQKETAESLKHIAEGVTWKSCLQNGFLP